MSIAAPALDAGGSSSDRTVETSPAWAGSSGALGRHLPLELARAFAADPALNGLARGDRLADEKAISAHAGIRSVTGASP